VKTLILMGFDEATSRQAVEIAGGDVDLAVDVCRQLSGHDPSPVGTGNSYQAPAPPLPAPVPAPKRMIIKRVIDADNSCLFNSIGYLLVKNKREKAPDYRRMVADEIRSKKDIYTADILGQSPDEYISWILNPEKWGGEIEMNILSSRLTVEIGAVDVQTGNLYLYGQEHGFTKRIYVCYDGIHYDAIAEALVDSHGCSKEEDDRTVFDPSDSSVVEKIKALAADLRSKKQFINLAGCDLQCLVCMMGLKGQKDAQEHAKNTGHQNFGQVNH
jgi:ubiquitin thioesterase OTU1